ncbi:MAG TPA: hypothetical protein DCK93_02395 [Blastocatellia bacterium]|nr:hypothetical protein [Blastocatellia bacterium]HAF21754.1 hypothetical protein [Blastocatellia bacterium]
MFDANTSGSYLPANDPRLIIGSGAATGVQSVKVQWPSGLVQVVTGKPIDRYLVIKKSEYCWRD